MPKGKRRQRAGVLRAPILSERRRRALGAAVILLGFIGALTGAGVKLRDPHTLPIRTVQIEGELRHLNRARLEQVAAPVVSGGFFSVDLRAVREALTGLPWVYRVGVRRQWPDRLVVVVEEQRPVAQWGESALVNPYGELFHPPREEFPQGLPVLRGPEGKARELLREYAALTERLAPLGLRVTMLEENERLAWRLRLDNGIEVALGREQRAARLERFVRVYAAALADRAAQIAAVDLRYTNGLAVAWRQASPAAAGTP